MEENQEGPNGYLEKLALITDAIQNTFPETQSALIFELEEKEYKEIQSHFRKIDSQYKKFKIDISGVEVIFILKNNEIQDPEPVIEEPPVIEEKIGRLRKFFNLLSGKKSS